MYAFAESGRGDPESSTPGRPGASGRPARQFFDGSQVDPSGPPRAADCTRAMRPLRRDTGPARPPRMCPLPRDAAGDGATLARRGPGAERTNSPGAPHSSWPGPVSVAGSRTMMATTPVMRAMPDAPTGTCQSATAARCWPSASGGGGSWRSVSFCGRDLCFSLGSPVPATSTSGQTPRRGRTAARYGHRTTIGMANCLETTDALLGPLSPCYTRYGPQGTRQQRQMVECRGRYRRNPRTLPRVSECPNRRADAAGC